jgi:hypothetical protein
MGILAKPYNFTSGTTIQSSQVNSDFDTIYNEFNGNIEDANIDASAGIAITKISGTAVNLSSTQTLTGKKTFAATVQTITTASDGSTVTFDLSLGNLHAVTLGGNRTLALSNASTGQCFIVSLTQDGTGSRTVTWFSTIRWANGTTPTLTTTASKRDVFAFICTGSNTYDGFIVGQNL